MANKKIYNSPEKWPAYGGAAQTWWAALTPEDRAKIKKAYEGFRERNLKSNHPYPDMYATAHLRVRELGIKQVYRIWVFRDRKETDWR